MGRHQIKIIHKFNAPVEAVFKILTNHEAFGRLIKAKIKRVKDSPDKNKNGLGSVRRIQAFPAIFFEETVISFQPNKLMEYQITKGSPVKNHKGRMKFTEDNGKTILDYTIDFEPKTIFSLFGPLIKKAIEVPMQKGLKHLAHHYETR